MKYRIIKALDKDGKDIYYVQRYNNSFLNWDTEREWVTNSYFSEYNNLKFGSIKKAKEYINKKIRENEILNASAIVVYEVEAE